MEKEMYEKVCVDCKETFESPYPISRQCSQCSYLEDLEQMARWGTN